MPDWTALNEGMDTLAMTLRIFQTDIPIASAASAGVPDTSPAITRQT